MKKIFAVLIGVIVVLLVIGVYAFGREGSVLETFVSSTLKDCYVGNNQWGIQADTMCQAGFSHTAWYQCTDPNLNKILTKTMSDNTCLPQVNKAGEEGGISWAYKVRQQCAMVDCSGRSKRNLYRIIYRIFNILP